MYPTLTRNAGPAKARNCRRNPADDGGTVTEAFNPSREGLLAVGDALLAKERRSSKNTTVT
jgi:hypothetical protein